MVPYVRIGPYLFYSFGIMIGIGTVLACIAGRSYFKRQRVDINVPVLCVVILIAGFTGAKLDYVLLYEPAGVRVLFQRAPLLLAQGGFTYFGGMVAAVFAATIYLRFSRIPFYMAFDGMFCVALAYGMGRIGCFLAGDGDYGVPTTLPWAVSFPNGIVPTTVRVHPTMLYIAVWEFGIFIVLWHISRRQIGRSMRCGTLLGCYLVASGVGRFFVELLSRNPVVASGLKEAQFVSLSMAFCGAFVLGSLPRSKRKSAADLWYLLGHS